MGRPRIYADATARQQACRTRQELQHLRQEQARLDVNWQRAAQALNAILVGSNPETVDPSPPRLESITMEYAADDLNAIRSWQESINRHVQTLVGTRNQLRFTQKQLRAREAKLEALKIT